MSYNISRREFLEFVGRSAVVAGAGLGWQGCAARPPKNKPMPFAPLAPTTADKLSLAPGFESQVLLRWRQPLNAKGERFGFNNDYLAFVPFDKSNPAEGLLWVNHEYHDPYHNSGWRPGAPRTREQFEIERKEVGGSIVHIKKSHGRWDLNPDSPYNRRLDAYTPIPFVSERPIHGHTSAIGTLANCAGGVTPWGTILSCEENYDNFVGDVAFDSKGKRQLIPGRDPYLEWTSGLNLPPEHYGWVVEVDLKTGKAKKQCALGRFAHECATCTLARDGRTVVYMADDTEDEHIYKFICRAPNSLHKGDLYVADVTSGRWLLLDRSRDPRLKRTFKDQTEMLIRTREAAKLVGATPMDRPEDIEIDPATGHIYIALTMSKKNHNLFGSILKIMEKDSDPLSLEFEARTFVAGGPDTGFACPDNLAFDRKGNLWMCTDVSHTALQVAPFDPFGNNSLFHIPLSGPAAGRALRVASAPNGAEFTGPCFAPDGETLFLSVQHPGERAHERASMKSSWPDGGDATPAPCVVALNGPAMQALLGP